MFVDELITLGAQTGPAQGWIGSWSPGIGDPNAIAWVIVVGYLVASFLCWRQFRRLDQAGDGQGLAQSFVVLLLAFAGARRRLGALPASARLRTLWLALAVVLLLLGMNKQLDLQTALTEFGRIWARQSGWYAVRRPVQVAFIGVVVLVGLGTLRAALALAGNQLPSLRAVLVGTIFLICFVTIRAASFHHIDSLLGVNIGGFSTNWLVELGGIVFIAAGAYRSRATVANLAS